MRPVCYRDGVPSREVEEDDDWEATGHEEMNRLHAQCKQKVSITDVRDRLCRLRDLVMICIEGLEHSKLIDIKLHVICVLYFNVLEELKKAEEELRHV